MKPLAYDVLVGADVRPRLAVRISEESMFVKFLKLLATVGPDFVNEWALEKLRVRGWEWTSEGWFRRVDN